MELNYHGKNSYNASGYFGCITAQKFRARFFEKLNQDGNLFFGNCTTDYTCICYFYEQYWNTYAKYNCIHLLGYIHIFSVSLYFRVLPNEYILELKPCIHYSLYTKNLTEYLKEVNSKMFAVLYKIPKKNIRCAFYYIIKHENDLSRDMKYQAL